MKQELQHLQHLQLVEAVRMLWHRVPLPTVYLLHLQAVYSSSSIIEVYDDSTRDMALVC
jgi:hypothetical protein